MAVRFCWRGTSPSSGLLGKLGLLPRNATECHGRLDDGMRPTTGTRYRESKVKGQQRSNISIKANSDSIIIRMQ
jgi:hypothetical protein